MALAVLAMLLRLDPYSLLPILFPNLDVYILTPFQSVIQRKRFLPLHIFYTHFHCLLPPINGT